MSAESSSALYPERPILPLPRRRLRERLSPDVADSIRYPPAPQTTTPLFAYPYSPKTGPAESGPESTESNTRGAQVDVVNQNAGKQNSTGYEESLMGQYRRSLASRAFQESQGGGFRPPQRSGQSRSSKPQAPPSTASSVDGYDSFENSNNKKKRKIPTAGEAILSGTHVLNDSSVLSLTSSSVVGEEEITEANATSPAAPYYQPGGPFSTATAQGISGHGRGRYGRVRNGRSPLRTLSDPNSPWNGRPPLINQKSGGVIYSPPPTTENPGIISSAIANADRLPLPRGQENISLLQQQSSTKSSPTSSSHFTFTFDSQNPVSWPGSDATHPHMGQSIIKRLSGDHPDARAPAYGRGTHAEDVPSGTSQSPSIGPPVDTNGQVMNQTTQPRKPKRRGPSYYHQAARQRKQQTEYQNYYHPPSPEEFWMCEYCEYESIFGQPPVALIKQYEIKDRRKRQEEAERRRLLEKAKMKSRKGKKVNNKHTPKHSNGTGDRNQSQSSADHHGPSMQNDQSPAMQSEEYEEDEFYEDDIHSDELSPVALDSHHPISQATPTNPADRGGNMVDGASRSSNHQYHR